MTDVHQLWGFVCLFTHRQPRGTVPCIVLAESQGQVAGKARGPRVAGRVRQRLEQGVQRWRQGWAEDGTFLGAKYSELLSLSKPHS